MSERDTDEWKFKLQEITDLLVAAGYFRARIPSLDAFDKIVGGMVWAITSSSFAVDVDVVFQENLTIGKKVKLSDKIVEALVKMKCPYMLRPHQIQGLDLPNIQPIIIWLVKSVISYQKVTGDLVRKFAEYQYDLDFNNEMFGVHQEDSGVDFIHNVETSFLPRRKFRKPGIHQLSENVDATLLEYGHRFVWHSKLLDEEEEDLGMASPKQTRKRGPSKIQQKIAAVGGKLGGVKKKTAAEKAEEQEQEAQKAEEARLENLKETLVETRTPKKISNQSMLNLIDASAIHEETQTYLETGTTEDATEDLSEFTGRRDAEFIFNRKKEQLEQKMIKLMEIRDEKREMYSELMENIENQSTETEAKKEENTGMEEDIKQLAVEEKSEKNAAMIAELKGLVQLNEILKNKEKSFKEGCRKQLQELRQLVRSVEPSENNEDDLKIQKIEAMFENDKKKYDKVRAVLASRNQDIARIRRKIDSFPSRAELLQYEKRFVELYEQSDELLKETRKYYDLFNTLQNTYEKMQNEVDLLESIQTVFNEKSLNNAGVRTNYVSGLQTAVDGLQTMKDDYNSQHENVKLQLETKRTLYNKLANRQRKYFMGVKDFQKEIERNEILMEELEAYQ